MSVRLRPALLLALAVALVAPLSVPAAVAQAPTGDYLQAIDLTFPTRPDAGLSDTYDVCRDGCARVHQAADLMGDRMWPLYATVDGEVCRLNDEPEEDTYGRHLTLCGDDGRQYRYLHLNNDTPGTDDGEAALEHVYAQGIRRGLRVARGQLLGYMGDSGNAEDTAPHLHLDVFDDRVVDPYGDSRINPYPSLEAALARGDVADGSVVASDPVRRVAGDDRVATAIELSRRLPVTSDTVVVARGDDPTDALVAGPLAAALGAPVLITPPHELDRRVLEEARRREATRAILVGTAPTAAVVASLERAGLTVERLAGDDRFGTADVVAEAVWAALDGATVANGTARRALLALGEHPDPTRQWPDAMMGSYLGAATERPVLLTAHDGLSSGTASLLEGLEVTVIGGPVAIPGEVIADLDATRLAGDDRYGTSVVVTEALRSRGRVGVDRVWTATGTNWPDAITAGPVVAALGEALVLVDGDGLGHSRLSSTWLHRFADATTEGRIIGGPAAVVTGAATGFGLDVT